MSGKKSVYINALGKFLPGDPIPNERAEDYLGLIGGKPSRLKSRIFKQNGIQTRHYALEPCGKINYRNYELAAGAVGDALGRAELDSNRIEFLAAATSQSDLLAPGFASLVHGAGDLPACTIASFQSVCAGSMMALETAYAGILSGLRSNSVVCASEFTSRFFRPGIFEETADFKDKGRLPFDAEFLRWMLSDGAGAAILEDRPNAKGLSLKIEWIDLISYADRFDVCMYSGANKRSDGTLGQSWYDYPNFAAAARDGAMLLKQDVRILDNIVKLGVNRYFELIERDLIKPDEIDWFVCHYSSHVFRSKIIELLEKGKAMIPENRWFTNLYTKGNTGAASIFIMLEELFYSGRLRPGQKILCMVPESGRFVVSFMYLTVADGEDESDIQTDAGRTDPTSEPNDIGRDEKPEVLRGELWRRLTGVWIDFESRLNRVPVIERMNRGLLRIEDYRLLLLNLRQQVIEGARWISRAASNLTAENFPLRSVFISHAQEEHRDFQMIERDFVSVGGALKEIQNAPKNVGSEALSAWMFDRAGRENPLDLLGAMFIIEGLGNRLAGIWGNRIREQLELQPEQVSFLLYHGANDENHLEKLEEILAGDLLTRKMVEQIVKTAKVTARLYALQLEELGNF
ncbi:MAG: 3-oxoacyl-[acyl-carrier-protein] synthase III C-terminal domain-containing protein [Pyrinomonadaceae bacterium]